METKYLDLLAQKYDCEEKVVTEIINLKAILNLPKGTEHFVSDLHGEYQAFPARAAERFRKSKREDPRYFQRRHLR
nr:fructose-bisphosphatase class III [Bacillus velezensis]